MPGNQTIEPAYSITKMNNTIAILLPNFRGDGAVRMMLVLASGFAEQGHQVDLLVVKNHGELASLVPPNVQVIDLKSRHTAQSAIRVARYLTINRPKALLATEHYTGLAAIYAHKLSARRTPVFIRQDNTWSMDVRRLRGRHRWTVPLAAKVLLKSATIIAVSKGVADDLIASLPTLEHNVRVIYNPAITPELRHLADARPPHPWFGDGGPPIIVAAGRLARAKGFDILIDAFSSVLTKIPARLVIIGEGPERQALESQIARLNLAGKCDLAGFQSNPYPFIRNADVFALSSRWEGLPTVLIEALHLDTPVVATNCPSGPAEILDHGRFGMLVQTEDELSLAAGLVEALEHRRAQDSQLNDWLEQFGKKRSVLAHLALMAMTPAKAGT